MPPVAAPHPTTYVVMLVALAVIVWRNMRGRRLRVEALWIMPVVMLALAAYVLAVAPQLGPAMLAGLILSFLLGGAVGWQRGRFTRIEFDPATHVFTSRASLAGMLFIVALFVVRIALRTYVDETVHSLAVAVNDALLLFAVGLVAAQRLEMWLRCRRILREARGAAA